MSPESMSPNYEYVFQRALSLSPVTSPRVLDYGCGKGEVVTHGREAGYEFWGVDMDAVASERPEAFRPLSDGRIHFDDNFFDVVISNQVFEHVDDPPKALAEIARVLKPGGVFLVLFPDKSAWFEGHVGLYFVHRMAVKLAYRYMMLCHRLGFGYYHEGRSAKEWADFMSHQLATEVFYHSPADLRRWWKGALGGSPQSAEADFMTFRLSASNRLRPLAGLARIPGASMLLYLVSRKRAGIVWITEKSK